MSSQRRLGRLFTELGVVNALLYLLDRVLKRLDRRLALSRYYLMAQPVPSQPLLSARRAGKLQIKAIASDDPLVKEFPRPATEIESRFANGGRCFVALKDGVMVGFIWVVLGSYREPLDRCLLTPQPAATTAWDLDVYVDPNERLGLCFARLWDAANDYLRAQGVSWTASRISAFNPGSLAAHRRLGARRVGQLWFIRAGKRQIMLATLAPYCHVSVRQQQAPQLIVDLRRLL